MFQREVSRQSRNDRRKSEIILQDEGDGLLIVKVASSLDTQVSVLLTASYSALSRMS